MGKTCDGRSSEGENPTVESLAFNHCRVIDSYWRETQNGSVY